MYFLVSFRKYDQSHCLLFFGPDFAVTHPLSRRLVRLMYFRGSNLGKFSYSCQEVFFSHSKALLVCDCCNIFFLAKMWIHIYIYMWIHNQQPYTTMYQKLMIFTAYISQVLFFNVMEWVGDKEQEKQTSQHAPSDRQQNLSSFLHTVTSDLLLHM